MRELNMVQALNEALNMILSKDPLSVIIGEDVGRDGGVFRVTDGLLQKFGNKRIIDTPLNELGIVGTAIGMASYGLRPIAEIQFQDFIFPAFDQIINQMAKIRYRSGGKFTAPVIIRTPYGGGIRGGLYHSQSGESYFVHTAGLVVVTPSNPYDAKGLLLSAHEAPDPVIFLEPKRLYRSVKNDVPEEEYHVEIGKAKLLREGNSISIITYGSMLPTVLNTVEKNNVDADVLDLITLSPLDIDSVLKSVKKTGRAIIVHEAPRTLGVGAEISALISERAIEYLYSPIYRVTGFDTPFPYANEEHYLPNEARIMRYIERALKF